MGFIPMLTPYVTVTRSVDRNGQIISGRLLKFVSASSGFGFAAS